MNEERKIEFTQKWIGDAVKKLLQKEDIYESDMEKIKYLRIGSDFANSYMIQMSTSTPPDPFYDTDGGDEWETALTGRLIQLYIDYAKENPSVFIDSKTRERSFQLTDFCFLNQYEEEYGEVEADWEDWEDTEKKWKSFEKTILRERYRDEEIDDDDAWHEWWAAVARGIQQDIGLFTGLEVLRTQGAEYQDMTFLRTMPRLRVWEVVESRFASQEGIDDLVRLKQLSCWLD